MHQHYRRPARKALVDQRAAILIRPATQVVVEDNGYDTLATQTGHQALDKDEVVQRGCREILRSCPAHDAPEIAPLQPAAHGARQPEQLAEFVVAGAAQFQDVRYVELCLVAIVESQFEDQLREGRPRGISRDHEARGACVPQPGKGCAPRRPARDRN